MYIYIYICFISKFNMSNLMAGCASGQGKQTSTCPISLQEMRQVKVWVVEEEISESEDEHDVSTRITSVDDECNYEDSDDDGHLECIWISDLHLPTDPAPGGLVPITPAVMRPDGADSSRPKPKAKAKAKARGKNKRGKGAKPDPKEKAWDM